jgi:hypothetical protein
VRHEGGVEVADVVVLRSYERGGWLDPRRAQHRLLAVSALQDARSELPGPLRLLGAGAGHDHHLVAQAARLLHRTQTQLAEPAKDDLPPGVGPALLPRPQLPVYPRGTAGTPFDALVTRKT